MAQILIKQIETTGTASSSTFLRGDAVWAVPPGGGGFGVPLAPGSSQTLLAGYGIVVPRSYFLITSVALILQAGSRFRIL